MIVSKNMQYAFQVEYPHEVLKMPLRPAGEKPDATRLNQELVGVLSGQGAKDVPGWYMHATFPRNWRRRMPPPLS